MNLAPDRSTEQTSGPPAATKRTVLASFETGDGTHCVDVFKREDGSFGLEPAHANSET